MYYARGSIYSELKAFYTKNCIPVQESFNSMFVSCMHLKQTQDL